MDTLGRQEKTPGLIYLQILGLQTASGIGEILKVQIYCFSLRPHVTYQATLTPIFGLHATIDGMEKRAYYYLRLFQA
jgi:hypothetical protein